VQEGKELRSGFVFFDGRYLEAPYAVTRRGLSIYVNETRVRGPTVDWPPRDVLVHRDPGCPKGLTETGSFEDIENEEDPYESAWHREYRYLMQHFRTDVAVEKMAEWFRGLPFVSSVEQEGGASLIVRTKRGEVRRYGVLRPPDPGYGILRNITREAVIDTVGYERSRFERLLSEDDCIFLFSNGLELTFGRAKIWKELGVITEILESERSVEEKTSLLQRLSILPPGNGSSPFSSLVTDFSSSPQLHKRIADLLEQKGMTPTSIHDIPQEIPVLRERRLKDEALKKARNTDPQGAEQGQAVPLEEEQD
jgi:hypothetical protein